MLSTSKKKHLDIISIITFSVVLALGTWNPISRQIVVDADKVDNLLSQIVTVLFVCFLALKQMAYPNGRSSKTWGNSLILFTIVFILSSLLGMPNTYTIPMSLFAKLILDILLTRLLFDFFIRMPEYMNYSLLAFALTCTVVGLLFITGFLDSFTALNSGRMIFWGENPNSTSTRIALGALILSYYIFLNPLKWGRKRYMFTPLLLPMFLMVLASGSRGSTLLMLLSIVMMLFLGENSVQSKTVSILVITSLILFFFYRIYLNYANDLAIYDRLISMTEGNDAGRNRLNKYAWEIFLDSPFIGFGSVGFTHEMHLRFGEDRTVHNLYYYILATTGIMGAIPFFYFLGYMTIKSLKIIRKHVLPTILMVFILLLVSKTGGVLTYSLIWYLFAVVLAYTTLRTTQGNKISHKIVRR